MQEDTSDPRVGKTENRNFERNLEENVAGWREADKVNY